MIQPFGTFASAVFFALMFCLLLIVIVYFLNQIQICILESKLRRIELQDYLLTRRIK